jgi:hypothetical protein
VNEDIIETLRSIQCSDVACGNLRVAMGLKLAIYEIERLRKERDEARRIACLQSCMGDDEPREWSPEDFAKQQGWDCFKENTQ